MPKETLQNPAIPVPSQSQNIVSLEPTWLKSLRNTLLRTVPAGLAIDLAEMVEGSASEQGVFLEFIQEVQNGLVVKVGSSELIGKLIARYITEILRNSRSAGELAEFVDQNKFDLTQAYHANHLNEETKEFYKQRVFQRFMSKLGPHGLKFIQTMQAKDANGWIAKIITKAQSDLPSPTISEFELLLKNAFRKQGSQDYVNNFSQYFVVKKILGAGTVGIAALIEYRASKDSAPKEYVAKIIREGCLEAFQKDFKYFSNAAELLVVRGEIPPGIAEALRKYNEELFERERLECNPNLEMCYLSQSSYEKEGVFTTVKGYLPLAGKAQGVVFMETAKGIELGKYLQIIYNSLAHASTEEEKKEYLEKLLNLRSLYAELSSFHYEREFNNESVHADLHPGNLFFDGKMLSVLDLGSMIHPLEPAEHLKLQRFLFALNLSLGTADSQFLRHYYQNEIKTDPKLKMEQIEPMLDNLQQVLDRLRTETADQTVIDVDVAADHVMGVIKDSILSVGVHIVPSALIIMAKANTPVNDTLNALRLSLASSSYENAIPYGQRTQFAIALRASGKKSLWNQETWDYFSSCILHPRAGLSQLQFEKKFVYGIFGLNEKEAAMADVLIPTAAVTAPIVLFLGGFYLKKLVNTVSMKLPEILDSYKVMQQFQQSKKAGVQQLTEFLALYKHKGYEHLNNWFSKHQPPSKDSAPKTIKQSSILTQIRNWFSEFLKPENSLSPSLQKLKSDSTSILSALNKAPYKRKPSSPKVPVPAPLTVAHPPTEIPVPPVKPWSLFRGNYKFFFRYSLPAALAGGAAVETYHLWKSCNELAVNTDTTGKGASL